MANITHDAQKERRERLKQKYGNKIQLTNTGDGPLQSKAGMGMAKTGSRSWGTHAKFLKTRKHLHFFSTRQGGTDETALASVGVCVYVK